MIKDKKSILLNVTTDLCNEIDQVITETDQNRTQFIKRSIIKNLNYMNKVELPKIREHRYQYDTIISSN